MISREIRTENRSARKLPIAAISRSLSMQVRGRTEAGVINKYARAMQNGAVFPCPTVAEVEGMFLLVDGFHRVAAIEASGAEELEVDVVRCTSREEALWLGYQLNLRHGLQLGPKRMRPAFRAYVGAGKHRGSDGLKSYRDIAQDIPGVSYSTIRRWMDRDFPAIFAEMGGGELTGVGGLSPAPSHQDILAADAGQLLDELDLLMGCIEQGGKRDAIIKRVRDYGLLWGGFDQPSYGGSLSSFFDGTEAPAVSLEQYSQRDAPF